MALHASWQDDCEDDCPFGGPKVDSEVIDAIVDEELRRYEDVWGAVHLKICRRAEAKVGSGPTYNNSFFDKHESLIARHYGVSVWLGIQWVPEQEQEEDLDNLDMALSTDAYLPLPKTSPQYSNFAWTWSDDNPRSFGMSMPFSCCADVEESGEIPTRAETARYQSRWPTL